MVTGGGGALGIAGEKARHGGPRGMAGAAADRRWGVFSGQAGRRTAAAGGGGLLFGRWWLGAQGSLT